MNKPLVLGLDFGTNSARALIVDPRNGREVATAVANYPSGEAGILLDQKDSNLARQNPGDWLTALTACTRAALRAARKEKKFSAEQIIGIGVDTTASTPMPVDEQGRPLCEQKRFARNLHAHAWLWKDHTSFAESQEITAAAAKQHPEYLAKCGGIYSSEWFWSKALRCIRVAPEVMQAASSWVEQCDFIPAVLTGNRNPAEWKRGVCAAGHKAMFHARWGLPDAAFLQQIHPRLGEVRRSKSFDHAYSCATRAGALSPAWAAKLGLPAGIPVAVGGIDAHLGAVGAGIKPGTLVKILGTSSCDMLIHPNHQPLVDIPGLCGIVDGSIVPGYFGLEAGQSAVGDIFNWFVNNFDKGSKAHDVLSAEAARLKPGAAGLLALDWNNGNRCVLVDPRLSGLLIGQTLHTTRAEVYRALIEATAFGARVIIDRLEEYGVAVKEVVNCGGIADKSPLVMQIYADVTGRPMKTSRSSQTCALGAAIYGAVVAGAKAGGYDNVADAQARMCALKAKIYRPVATAQKTYQELFRLYRKLHDAFGTQQDTGSLHEVMKDLLILRDKVRGISK